MSFDQLRWWIIAAAIGTAAMMGVSMAADVSSGASTPAISSPADPR